ncbi:hypothetical protein PDM29_20700 (plasmid) [Stenotrophomonas oahuensis]|uniref:Bacterial mobilisation domain-containing protein n=1 Tax=Stenotrophomonas oahuensis TaxID=3003271 RepID=A0ABY9YV95_9GAMM|nr:hypothetical protein [Stenotrophomonas sp. A5586]WNH54836.1 hypothetical protein PDM29_20700 [Stenotrophomonas sp. A5586]
MAPQLWAALDEVARSQGVSTNALLEALAAQAQASAVAGDPVPVERQESDQSRGSYKGVYIRLRAADRDAFREQAASAGYTVTGWLTALARSASRQGPLLVHAEIEGLIEALRQLAAVGRNLNTVVHQLHRSGRWAGNLDLYASLLETVKRSRARVEDVIARAHERAEGY